MSNGHTPLAWDRKKKKKPGRYGKRFKQRVVAAGTPRPNSQSVKTTAKRAKKPLARSSAPTSTVATVSRIVVSASTPRPQRQRETKVVSQRKARKARSVATPRAVRRIGDAIARSSHEEDSTDGQRATVVQKENNHHSQNNPNNYTTRVRSRTPSQAGRTRGHRAPKRPLKKRQPPQRQAPPSPPPHTTKKSQQHPKKRTRRPHATTTTKKLKAPDAGAGLQQRLSTKKAARTAHIQASIRKLTTPLLEVFGGRRNMLKQLGQQYSRKFESLRNQMLDRVSRLQEDMVCCLSRCS